MPEGHSIHRLAYALGELFGGNCVRTTSPQGRFREGAEILDGLKLVKTEAHGKHLLVEFAPETHPNRPTWLHVHLGIYGSWTFVGDSRFRAPTVIGAPRKNPRLQLSDGSEQGAFVPHESMADRWEILPGETDTDFIAPPPKDTVRLRIQGEHGIADLTGPNTCELLDEAGVQSLHNRLGPDPLREDSQAADFFAAAWKSTRPIGQILMEQSMISGVGNIYRAEALFIAKVSPFAAGKDMPERKLQEIWDVLCRLMPEGKKSGRITTVPVELTNAPNFPDDPLAKRYFVYQRTGYSCIECGRKIREELLNKRRLYWCPGCQRLRKGKKRG